MTAPVCYPPDEPAGVYVHVPFCAAICPYCDFAVTTASAPRRARLVDALRREIASVELGGFDTFDTIYLGGGTPSVLSPEQLAGILRALRERLPLTAAPWIAMEVNPEDVTPTATAAWRALGVQRLSLGVQSLDDDRLRTLGRRHTADQARAAVGTALSAGFESVSVDLIYGGAGQTEAGWRRELADARALGAPHLSCYQLTISPGTPFGRRAAAGEHVDAPESAQAALFEATHTLLAAAGWPAYEVSNFARAAAHESRHNRKYWRHVPYLGLGPSAHSYADARRWWNVRGTTEYVARVEAGAPATEAEETLTASQRALEALMLGLRTPGGVDLAAIGRWLGLPLAQANRSAVARAVAAGLVERDGDRIRPTRAGLARADGLAASLELGLDNGPVAGDPGP